MNGLVLSAMGPLGKEANAKKIEASNEGYRVPWIVRAVMAGKKFFEEKSLEDYLGCHCFIRFLPFLACQVVGTKGRTNYM